MISFKKEVVDSIQDEAFKELVGCEFKVRMFTLLDKLDKKHVAVMLGKTNDLITSLGSDEYDSFCTFAWIREYQKSQKADITKRYDYMPPKHAHLRKKLNDSFDRMELRIETNYNSSPKLGRDTYLYNEALSNCKAERFDAITKLSAKIKLEEG